MQKKLLYIVIITFILLITGCNNTTNDETVEDVPIAEDNSEQPAVSIEEAVEIVENLLENVTAVFIEAGAKYNLVNNPLTDETYALLAEDLKPFVTDSLLQSKMRDIAEQFCYGGCDAHYFPSPPSYSLRFQFVETTNEKVTLTYIFPEDELTPNLLETVTMANVDGIWKLDYFESEITPLHLTKEEAEEMLRLKGINNYRLIKEVEGYSINGHYEKIYIYEVDGQEQLGIYEMTGYLFPYDEEVMFTSQKEAYLHKMMQLEKDLSYVDDLYENLSNAEMANYEQMRYEQWDALLNEIYGVLKEKLSTSEMDALTNKQLEWIRYRDQKAEDGASMMSGGWYSIQLNHNLWQLTKERCYELVEDYM